MNINKTYSKLVLTDKYIYKHLISNEDWNNMKES